MKFIVSGTSGSQGGVYERTTFWDVAPCSLVEFDPEVLNASIFRAIYTTLDGKTFQRTVIFEVPCYVIYSRDFLFKFTTLRTISRSQTAGPGFDTIAVNVHGVSPHFHGPPYLPDNIRLFRATVE
jgi:hypothetical protein